MDQADVEKEEKKLEKRKRKLENKELKASNVQMRATAGCGRGRGRGRGRGPAKPMEDQDEQPEPALKRRNSRLARLTTTKPPATATASQSRAVDEAPKKGGKEAKATQALLDLASLGLPQLTVPDSKTFAKLNLATFSYAMSSPLILGPCTHMTNLPQTMYISSTARHPKQLIF